MADKYVFDKILQIYYENDDHALPGCSICGVPLYEADGAQNPSPLWTSNPKLSTDPSIKFAPGLHLMELPPSTIM